MAANARVRIFIPTPGYLMFQTFDWISNDASLSITAGWSRSQPLLLKWHAPLSEEKHASHTNNGAIKIAVTPQDTTHSQIEPELTVWRQLNFSNGPCFGLC
jgi:hypothetical protein